MSTAISLALLLVFLASGFGAARARLVASSRVTDRAFSVALYLLLLSMGLRLGQSREILADLPLIGTLAACSTLCACAGTVLLHLAFMPAYRALDRDGLYSRRSLPSGARIFGARRVALLLHNLKKPATLLVLVAVGTVVGFFLPQIPVLRDGTVATWLLYFLLFVIGIQMAGSGTGLKTLVCQPAVLLAPAVTVVGTLAGSLGTLAFDGMTVGKSFALASGFGWYSLSGVLISDLGDPLLGTAAFVSNLLRETLAFLTVPLLAATGRCESGVGISGATSMDVTLPVVEDTWGPDVLPLSVAHGVILSFLVPFLVPLFMSF